MHTIKEHFEALDGISTHVLHTASVSDALTDLLRPHMLGPVNCEFKYSVKLTIEIKTNT